MLPGTAVAAFPGHNGRIVFGNSLTIFSVRPDGRGLRRVTSGWLPDVAPDGRRLTFADNGGHRRAPFRDAIYSARLGGAARHRLTDFEFNTFPAFSGPLGRQIVFSHIESHTERLRIMRSDGSGKRGLTREPRTSDFAPEFSPDGEWIAFSRSTRANRTEIYKMRPDGTDLGRLTHAAPASFGPDFSPNGKRIVFNRFDRQREGRILMMRANGQHVHRISEKHANVFDPAFSPNGRRIAYVDEDFHLFTMRRNGSGARQVTDRRGAYPDWAPRR
jgi:Tol biopolymer transport system component